MGPHSWTGPGCAPGGRTQQGWDGRNLERLAIDHDLLEQATGSEMRVLHHVHDTINGAGRHRCRFQLL